MENEVYFDDSGTNSGSPIAVAACYIAKKTQWDEFARNLDDIARDEGFDCFHMVDFVAKPEHKKRPFCDWDNNKKDHVYRRLAGAISVRIRCGFAVAVPKKAFDRLAREDFREDYAIDHYSFAVTSLLNFISAWRARYNVTEPMHYVFDQGSKAQEQITAYWSVEQCVQRYDARHRYGIVPEGVTFGSDCDLKPLQAADIYAWQVQNHMRRTLAEGKNPNDRTLMHKGFRMLEETNSRWYTEEFMEALITKINKHKDETGEWSWDTSKPTFDDSDLLKLSKEVLGY